MTRTRKSTGRIAFVGAGPGDPGLPTRRAYDALLSADHIVHDRNVPEALLSVIRGEVEEDTQFSPAEGAPGDVAKVLLSAARSGLRAVHLVAGDPSEHDAVVNEVQSVARTAVPFEVVPGVSRPAGVATYAGVALSGVRTTVEVDDVRFLRRHAKPFRAIKITVPGPFTMSQQAQNEFYPTEEAAAMDYAVALNAEIKDLFANGADVVQVDEPYMQARPDKARVFLRQSLQAD